MSEIKYTVGILVVSDSCSKNQAIDTSGPNLKQILSESYTVETYDIVADDVQQIKSKLVEWSDVLKLNLILTCGGTGFAHTDVTPEATKEVLDKEIPSITNAILFESLKITKFAVLSRAIAGIRQKSLIINLPGSKKGSSECLNIILPVLKHALNLINDVKNSIKIEHKIIQNEEHPNNLSREPFERKHNLKEHHKSKVTKIDILAKPRQSVYPMIQVDEALKLIIENSNNIEIEELFYMDALNYVNAEDILAQDPLPPFDASVKDGFAIKLPSNYKLNDTVILNVIGASNAGDDVNIELNEGECVKINTGAYVPKSADAVVQIEDTLSLENNEFCEDTRIIIKDSQIKRGQDIRPIGFDIKIGEIVVKKNALINAAQLGICATVGALNIKVYKKPIISLISTGNELLPPDNRDLTIGKIRDSNKSLLFGACKQIGIDNIIDSGIAHDNPDSVLEIFRNALDKADIIVSTGGVSMGDKDLVKDVLLKDLNCIIHFARLNMKPGKPTTFATCLYKNRKKLLFCLPGNPVSAIVTFNLVVVPSIRKLMGYDDPFHTRIKAELGFDAELDPRPEYHRGILKWNHFEKGLQIPLVYSTGNQHSSRLLSMNQANCLIELPACTKTKNILQKGEIVTVLYIEKL